MALLGIYTFAAFVESVADAGCICRDSRRASGSRHGLGLGGFGAGDAGESVWLAAARAHLSLSERSLPDEPDRRVPLARFSRLGAALFCGHPAAGADRVCGQSARKLRLSHLLVVLLAAYAGFYSSRNLPVSSMLLVLIAGPILWENFVSLAEKPGAWRWVRNGAARISEFSDRMGAQEMQLRGHLWPVVSVALAFAICLQGGWLGSRQLIHAQFDPQKMPVAAVNFLQNENGRASEHGAGFLDRCLGRLSHLPDVSRAEGRGR